LVSNLQENNIIITFITVSLQRVPATMHMNDVCIKQLPLHVTTGSVYISSGCISFSEQPLGPAWYIAYSEPARIHS
jgi:hypothetical protein